MCPVALPTPPRAAAMPTSRYWVPAWVRVSIRCAALHRIAAAWKATT